MRPNQVLCPPHSHPPAWMGSGMNCAPRVCICGHHTAWAGCKGDGLERSPRLAAVDCKGQLPFNLKQQYNLCRQSSLTAWACPSSSSLEHKLA